MVELLAWQVGIARLRHKRANYLKAFVTTTPEGIEHWITDEFVDKCEDGKRKGKYKLYTASSRENIYNPTDYVEDLLESYDDKLAQAYVDGQIIDMTEGRAYHAFGNHNIKELQYNPHLNLGLTCDFNVQPMVWEIFQYSRNRIEFFDEILIKNNASTESAVSIFCDRYFELMKKKRDRGLVQVNIFGDSSGQARTTAGDADYISIRDVLRARGIPYVGNVPESNPLVRNRLNSVNAALKDRGNETKVLISPKCERLIKDFRLVVLAKNGDIDKRRKELTHASDAAGYAIYKIMPIRDVRIRQTVITHSRF